MFVSWLPLYHDMGLIGAWLAPLYFGLPVAIFSPLAFLSRPVRWLRAFHRYRATVGAAPNFAYELCLSKLADSQLEPAKWTDVEGWTADDHLAAFTAYQTSCQVFLKIKRPPDDRPIAGGLWDACRRAAAWRPSSGCRAAPR